MYESLKELVRDFPLKPGVYLMKNGKNQIIYVGKARALRNRVKSYFTGRRELKTRILADHIKDIEYIVTENEYEALILEDSLIKKWTPRYNINLKDGKSYPVLRITNEDFPRAFRTRTVIEDGSDYFGPFTSAVKLDNYLKIADRIFLLRKCRGKLKTLDSPCLYYHIGRCAAPCVGRISKADYGRNVAKFKKLLSGNTEELVSELEISMNEAAASLKFEKAAELRDLIESVRVVELQADEFEQGGAKRDYISLSVRDNICTFAIYRYSEGRLDDRSLFRTQVYSDSEDAVSEFFLHYYGDDRKIPEQIYISEIADKSAMEEFLGGRKGSSVEISVPEDGKHFRILQMVKESAVMDVDARSRTAARVEGLEELKSILNLPKLPRRIEGFDISHLAGKHTVSSLVSFHNGVPDKKNYRKFHIKSLKGAIDDFESIREAVARRYSRVINEGLQVPDLIVIDGGKGQVRAAHEILKALGLEKVPVIGLAKKNEEIFLPDYPEPFVLPESSEALKVVQAVRDETHRFATGFNRQLREKDIYLSRLEKVPGIGIKRSRNLLMEFESLENIIEAGPGAVSRRAGISEEAAENVINYLKKDLEKFDKQ